MVDRRDQFGVLLGLLVASFLLTGIDGSRFSRLLGAGLTLAALASGFASTGLGKDRRRLVVLGGVAVGGAALVVAFEISHPAAAMGALGEAFVLGVVLSAVVARILRHTEVDLSTILGAIAA